jgi:hypothetical protein
VYYLARYSSNNPAKQKRIISNYFSDSNFAAGFHNSKVRVYYVSAWVDDCDGSLNNQCPSEPATPAWIEDVSDWVIIGFKYSATTKKLDFRANGGFAGRTYEGEYVNNVIQLGINAGVFGIGGTQETSDFELAKYLVFNRALPDSEMIQVEKQLAREYGISLAGSDPVAPVLSQPTVNQDSFPIFWTTPSATGDGELYKYQVRLNDSSQPDSWSYVDVAAENLEYDFVQDGGMRMISDATFNVQVRAVTTSGLSAWSNARSISYVASSPVIVTPPPVVTVDLRSPPVVTVDLRSVQSVAPFATSVKRGKYLKLPMTTQQGIRINYLSSRGCKVSKTYKTKSVKVGKKTKKVKTHVGWRLLGQKKKASCVVQISAPGSALVTALSLSRVVRVR